MALNFDLIEPAVLTGFVRELPGPANLTLATWLPDDNIHDIEAAFTTVTKRNRAAMFRSYDAETPVGQRGDFSRSAVALPPIGQKTVVTEEERLRLESLRSGGDNTASLIRAIYNDAQINTEAVLNRMEMARGQVLSTGKFTLAGENGLTVEADFGVASSHKPTAAVEWDDYENAVPLGDLRTWADLFADDAGESPAYVLTSRTAIGHIMRCKSVTSQFVNGAGGTVSFVTRAQLAQLLASLDLPQLVEYNTQLYPYGSNTATKVIPVNKAIMLPGNPRSLGRTAWGVTAEAIELVGLNNPQLQFAQAPGLVGEVLKTSDPVRTWTNVAAIGMPVIEDPNKILSATVFS